MDAVNTLRAILAATAALAAVLAGLGGYWVTAAVLGLGVAAHGWLWVRRHRPARPAPGPDTAR